MIFSFGSVVARIRSNAMPKVSAACPAMRHYANYPVSRPFGGSNGYQRFDRKSTLQRRRFWITIGTGTLIFGGYYVSHLEKVPVSGRIRFMDVSPRQEKAMAKQAYHEIMSQLGHRILPDTHPYTLFVKRVGRRLVRVSGMEDLDWEFHVIDSPELNAFILPGGKVFVFTGILPVVQNEDGMAAVLGHELSHQLARHSAEKLSFTKVLFVIQVTLSLFGIDTSFIFNQMTLNFMMLKPFSRRCETEADIIGLQLMAQACFDPREAKKMWERMETVSGRGVPQFASTHPSHKNRIEKLEKEMPMALEKLEQSDCSTELGRFVDPFRDTWVRW